MQVDVKTDDESLAAAAGSGALLREAREQRQLSVEDVAHTLRLTPQIILALETGDYSALGPAVFVRGYLRNYAKLLELPQHLALAESPSAEVEPEAFRTMSMRTEIKPGVNLHRWVIWSSLALLLLIAVVILLSGVSDPAAESSAPDASLSAGAAESPLQQLPAAGSFVTDGGSAPGGLPDVGQDTSAPTVVADSLADTDGVEPGVASGDASVSGAVDGSAAGQASVVAQGVSEPAATEQPVEPSEPTTGDAPIAPTAGKVPLRLTFTDECWVEIADSRRSLLYGLEKGGSVVDLEGVPPFRIFVGNRKAVQVAVAGRPFPIPPGSQDDGNTARFTVEPE